MAFLLLENGGHLLLENGGRLLLELPVTPAQPTEVVSSGGGGISYYSDEKLQVDLRIPLVNFVSIYDVSHSWSSVNAIAERHPKTYDAAIRFVSRAKKGALSSSQIEAIAASGRNRSTAFASCIIEQKVRASGRSFSYYRIGSDQTCVAGLGNRSKSLNRAAGIAERIAKARGHNAAHDFYKIEGDHLMEFTEKEMEYLLSMASEIFLED